MDDRQIKLLEAVSQTTHISKSSLIRQGVDLVLQKFKEDVISVELHREIDAMLKEDKELLNRLAKAWSIFIQTKFFIFKRKLLLQAADRTECVTKDYWNPRSIVHRLHSGGQDLYPDLFTKAAASGHSLICNHAFIDGNKRIGYETMRLIFRTNGYDLHGSQNDKFDFIMSIAQKKLNEQGIVNWLKANSKPLK